LFKISILQRDKKLLIWPTSKEAASIRGKLRGALKRNEATELDYDNYWDEDINAHLSEFVLLSKAEYEEVLKKAGFFVQESQRSIFEELNRGKKRKKEKKRGEKNMKKT